MVMLLSEVSQEITNLSESQYFKLSANSLVEFPAAMEYQFPTASPSPFPSPYVLPSQSITTTYSIRPTRTAPLSPKVVLVNASLSDNGNIEIVLLNVSTDMNMHGWTLLKGGQHLYTFQDYMFHSTSALRIGNGDGRNRVTDVFIGDGEPSQEFSSGDIISLRDQTGALVDRFVIK